MTQAIEKVQLKHGHGLLTKDGKIITNDSTLQDPGSSPPLGCWGLKWLKLDKNTLGQIVDKIDDLENRVNALEQ